MRRRTVLAGATIVVAGLTLVPGCASSSKGSSGATSSTAPGTASPCKPADDVKDTPSQISVTLKEWAVGIDPPLVRAGKVAFIATNAGQNAHELLIVKSVQTLPIPSAPDGSIDEAKIDPSIKVGALPVITPGKTCGAEFELTAGNYLLFCNLVTAGTVHYRNGMAILLTVVP